ncbi:hypothetical protein B0I35DRAFT_329098, partial [Stachybotrys elegans]
ITASSRGLSRVRVEVILASGDNVIATARDPASLDDLTTALYVTDGEAVSRVLNESRQVFECIDVVINNAGYADISPLETVTIHSFKKQVETNSFGTVWVTRAAIRIMREQGSGHIIQVSSLGGHLSTPRLAAYQSAKWAVGSLRTVLAGEVAHFGIKMTAVEPGRIKTDWAGSSM